MKRLAGVSLIGVLAVFLTGCAGYQLGPTGNSAYRTVAVPMFKNKTLKPQLEAPVTNAILKRFQTDGTLRVVEAVDADVVLSGEITKFYRREVRTLRADIDTPREYRTFIEVVVNAQNRATGKPVFPAQTITGSTDTFVGTDLQSADQQAIPLIAENLARRVVTLVAEQW